MAGSIDIPPNFPYLTAILLCPLVAAVIIMLTPAQNRLAIRLIAMTGAFLALALAILVYLGFDPNATGFQFVQRVDWAPALGITYHVGIDGISLAMVLLTAFIISMGVFATWTTKHRDKEFYALLLILVTGVFGVFMILDLFFFFLFYEIAVLPMYLLIGIWGTGNKQYSAMKLTLYLLVGSAFMLIGILAVYFSSGIEPHTFNLVDLLAVKNHFTPVFARVVLLMFYIGFGILAGIWPLHTWSPDGHASAPTAVSMLHAGVLMKLGAYGFLRIGVQLLPGALPEWAWLIGGIATINIVYGAFCAMGQSDLKYVIAYSSVSHMGVVMLGIAAADPIALNGAVFQMFAHGIMTGLFFALVGLVYEKSHTRDMGKMSGFGRKMPGIWLAFTIGGLSSFGLPGTAGFVAELLVFLGAFRSGNPYLPYFAVISVIGVVVTAAYVLRMLQRIFFGEVDKKEFGALPDAKTTEWVSLVVLASLLLIFGLFPSLLTGIIAKGLEPIVTALGTAVRPL